MFGVSSSARANRGRSVRTKRLEIPPGLGERDDFCVLRLQIEEVGVVSRWRTIADRFAYDHRNKAMLAAIEGARADAAARGHSADQQCVDAHRREQRGERGCEESARVLF